MTKRIIVLLMLVIVIAGTLLWYVLRSRVSSHLGVITGNGTIEATEVDVT